MAIKIQFDSARQPVEPTLVLTTRSGRKIGRIPASELRIRSRLNDKSELSFSVYKELCPEGSNIWEEMEDLKLIWVREWNRMFEARVEVDDGNAVIKSVSAVSLGEAELSQIHLYNVEINTETDIAREDYKPTVLYNDVDTEASLLHRILKDKVPHYRIGHVDATIAGIQRTFTFDNKTIYDAFQEIAEEIHCLFVLDCSMDSDGKVQRVINVYDLESNCMDCGERGEFSRICPKCGGSNLFPGYGTDTTIFVTKENLSDRIVYTTDVDSVKNCFRLVAGDDLMTATVAGCNPNGSSYLWYFSDEMKRDMSKELVEKLEAYDKQYEEYQNSRPIELSQDVVDAYNALVDKYSAVTDKYKKITTPLIGYPALMEAYYNAIDFHLYLSESMMPGAKPEDTNAEKEAARITRSALSPIAVRDLEYCSAATADSAVLAMARALVDRRYQVKTKDSAFSGNRWSGAFVVSSYYDEDDTATTGKIDVVVNEDYERYVRQKIDQTLSRSITQDVADITVLFKMDDTAFAQELTRYSLSQLTSLRGSCQACIDVLIDYGVGNEDTWTQQEQDLYNSLYLPYYYKLGYIEAEMQVREKEVGVVNGVYDRDGHLASPGVLTEMDEAMDKVHAALDFQDYLGEELWMEFSAYRREDTYQNSNYISDGLDNAELFDNARRFLDVAGKEIVKSATMQHSISSTLRNLLVMHEFEPIVDYFEVGNWIRIRVDDEVYRLRLIEYDIDFTDLSDLEIVFSDVTRAGDSVSDIQSVLGQASSMASSYDSTKRQADKGADARTRYDNWVQRGLDATNIKLISDTDNQIQTWDEHGMLFQKYDPVLDEIDPCQIKVINSTLAVTDDNWKSVKTAIGRFYYFDPETGKLKSAYGVNAEVVIGKMILGENLGIYTGNNAMTFDKNGLRISNGVNTFSVNPNDKDGLLSLANDGGKILWVDEKGGLHIRGDGTGLDIEANDSITGLSSRIEQTANSITTEISNKYDGQFSKMEQTINNITTEIYGKYDGQFSRIDQELESITSTVSGYDGRFSEIEQTVSGITSKVGGYDDQFSQITQSIESIETQVSGLDLNGQEIVSRINQTADGVTITAQHIKLEGYTSINNYFTVDTDGKMTCTGGTIAGFTISSGELSNASKSLVISATSGRIDFKSGASSVGTFGVARNESYGKDMMWLRCDEGIMIYAGASSYTSEFLLVARQIELQSVVGMEVEVGDVFTVYVNNGGSISLSGSRIDINGDVYVNDQPWIAG